MKKYLTILAALTLCMACGDEQETYPSILTEMADAYVDAEGILYKIETDRGQSYTLTNPQQGFKPESIYRTLSGFVPQTDGSATLYQMKGVHILRDSTAIGHKDPTGILSAWRAGRYINLHLQPKTQGGTHYWGFTVDSVAQGKTWIGLHHRQNNDPLSYSQDVYASIPVDSIKTAQPGDTLTITIATFDGTKTWTFKK